MGRGKLVFKGDKKAKKRRNGGGGSSGIKSRPVESASLADGDARAVARPMTPTRPGPPMTTSTMAMAVARCFRAWLDCPPGEGRRMIMAVRVLRAWALVVGRGLISTSSSVVMGHGTSFKSKLRVGDAILVPLATSNDHDEMRVITMILSNALASISLAFSLNLKTHTVFRCINRPRDDVRNGVMRAARARREQEEVNQRAVGT